jgi:nifR3 family TIM-barrel protein
MLAPTFHVRDIPVFGDAVLSPMDGYSDLPFRRLCRELGSAMSYTEFVKVDDVLDRVGYVEEKLAFSPAERPLVYQIYGDDPDLFLAAALEIRGREPDIIDINMGCPAKSISARGAGVGLMRTPEKIAAIFSKLTSRLDIPVTGKIRLGWDDDNRNYLEVARIVQENGGQLLAVHGRTKVQGYGGEADWEAIGEIASELDIPVIGNGDVLRVEDIARLKAQTGCAGVMIGRAAMSNPWIFMGKNREDVSPGQVQKTMLRHLELNLAFYGPERGLVLFRKFAARYLAPYRLPKPIRQRLLTAVEAPHFVDLLAEIVQAAEFEPVV